MLRKSLGVVWLQVITRSAVPRDAPPAEQEGQKQETCCLEQSSSLSFHFYRLFIVIHLQIVLSTFCFSYQYAECVDCLRKSTNINFLQEGVWFSMGYAANQIADYNTAVESFRNCVTLEPEVCAVPHLVCVLQLDCKLLSSKYCCLLVCVEWRSLE